MPLPPLADPKSRKVRVFGIIRGTLSGSFLITTLVALNLFQTASLLLLPFSPVAFRKFNRWAAGTWWGLCDTGAEKLYGIKIVISGDIVPEKENAFVVCNHQQMPDINVLFGLVRSKKRLGDLKWFVKDVIKYVPGVGWGMLFLDCIFVKRNWTDDQDYIHGVFDKIITNKIPLWLVSFVEGGRMTPERLKICQKYAEVQGLHIPQHVLIPRTKGFAASVDALRGHIKVVYDITIGYVDGVPTLWQWLEGHVHRVHLHVRRFEIDELPTDHDELSSWLYDIFEQKDELLEHFYHHGSFPETQLEPPTLDK
jgi:1-acyl-sn-glycerol-3-phosphate acyltransferase